MALVRLLDNNGLPIGGAHTLFRSIDVDETEDEIKGEAGALFSLIAINASAAVLYLKLYDAAAADVVVGTTIPALTIPVPTTGDTNGAGFVWDIPGGLDFQNGISVAATTGIADNDTGAPGANEMIVNAAFD